MGAQICGFAMIRKIVVPPTIERNTSSSARVLKRTKEKKLFLVRFWKRFVPNAIDDHGPEAWPRPPTKQCPHVRFAFVFTRFACSRRRAGGGRRFRFGIVRAERDESVTSARSAVIDIRTYISSSWTVYVVAREPDRRRPCTEKKKNVFLSCGFVGVARACARA